MKAPSARGLFRATGKVSKQVTVSSQIDLAGTYERADHKPREVNGFYPTPSEPIRAFIHAEGARLRELGQLIWEPAAGDGALAREMRAAGFDVACSDLIDRGCSATIRDFYSYAAIDAPSTVTVTNPPWECGQEWAAHARLIGSQYVALLLPWKWPASAKMAALWDKDPPARAYLMRWRIDWTGAGANPSNDGWYVWDGKTAHGETRLLMLDRKDGRQGELL